MATSGANADLVDRLIQTVTNLTADHKTSKFNELRRAVHSTFRASSSNRINQFAVIDRIKGLEEKARVFNYTELADALHERIIELDELNVKWSPEYLSLLLSLSDSPIERTAVEDLSLCEQPVSLAKLTWEDIYKDDPPDHRDGLWDDVDFRDDSSVDDDYTNVGASPPADTGSESTFAAEHEAPSLGSGMDLTPDTESILELQRTRSELSKLANAQPTESIAVTEHQLIRETILMLLGLPTDLYSEASGSCLPKSGMHIQHVSPSILKETLSGFAAIGTRISAIREWVEAPEQIPHVRTFQYSVHQELSAFDVLLCELENQCLKPTHIPITLLTTLSAVRLGAQQLLSFSDIVTEQEQAGKAKPFLILESLHDLVCSSQVLGSAAAYVPTARIFFECFKTYLRPMKTWMTTGEIEDSNSTFFVARVEEVQPLALLWSNRFKIVYDNNEALHAPSFLHLAAQKILTTGKSVHFLRALGYHDMDVVCDDKDLLNDFTKIVDADVLFLQPFDELFVHILDSWVTRMHQSFSSRLRGILESRYGLLGALDALEHIYFSRNGAAFDQASDAICDRIDQGLTVWNDVFLTTDSWQEAFARIGCVDENRLSTEYMNTAYYQRLGLRSIQKLGGIKILYTLPWPIANIIKPHTFQTYQQVAVLLLQLRRAKQVLAKHVVRNKLQQHSQTTAVSHLFFSDSLRHLLQWFVDTFSTYLKNAVLDFTNSKFVEDITNAADLDDMIQLHAAFILKVEVRCLIAGKFSSTQQAITALLDLVIVFSDTSSMLDELKNPHQTAVASSEENPDNPNLPGQNSKAPEKDDEARLHGLHESVLAKKLEKQATTFNRLMGFVLAGVRDASRNEGDPCLRILAESLALGSKHEGGLPG